MLMMDVALHTAKELSMLMPDLTKQLDATKQNMTELVDVVAETKELSIQLFEAVTRCP